MEDWTISKTEGKCSGTDKLIKSGEEYYAALVETPEGLQRRDFCSEFWNEKKPQVYCFWKTKMPPPDQKKKLFIDDEMLFSFFDRLASETDSERLSFRFVLALVLMRKRKLKYDSTKLDGNNQVWHLRITGSDRYVDVVNPNLDEAKIESLSAQLSQILQTDL